MGAYRVGGVSYEAGVCHRHDDVRAVCGICKLLTDITPDLCKELLNGEHPEIVVECRQGISLPLKYLCNAGFFSIKYEPNLSFKVEKTCYLRLLRKGRCDVSFDLINWDKPNFKLLDTTLVLCQRSFCTLG